MEEAIIVVLQIFFEILFNSMVSLPFDWFFGWRELDEGWTGCLLPMLFLIVGAGCGWISLLLLPKLLIPLVWLRLINLILSPVVAGSMAAFIASQRDKLTSRDQLRVHFFNAFLFTLAFTAVRWAYSK